MPTPVIMPKFEMAQETGTVLRWLKREGETVQKGEPILEVETDKVTMEVEAPASGVLAGIQAAEGAVVPVGQPIAHIVQPGQPWPETGAEAQPTVTAEPAAPTQVAPSVQASPLAQRVARAAGIDLRAVPGTGPGGRITRADVEAYLAQQRSSALPAADERVKAVPAARRLARELGVDLRRVTGTGPGGRIQSEDVRRAAAAQAVRPSTLEGGPRVRRTLPLTGMRRTIAQRMSASVREAPQFTASVDVDVSRALALVEDVRSRLASSDGPRVTLTAFLVKACAWVLQRHPTINASLEGENIVEWADINIGVAVALEEGLVVPVIHGADGLGLVDIAARLADLTTRAREGRLRPQDVQGGTFTLSNLGMFGVDRFTAILNPPQAAILAVGRVTKRPLVVADDRVVVRPMATLTLTADHRVVDGALVGRFLADLQGAIEGPGVLM